MTGPGANPPGGKDRNKRADLGGADAVPDTPHTSKPQGAGLTESERRLTPRAIAETSATSGMKPVIWVVLAIAAMAAIYLFWGMR